MYANVGSGEPRDAYISRAHRRRFSEGKVEKNWRQKITARLIAIQSFQPQKAPPERTL